MQNAFSEFKESYLPKYGECQTGNTVGELSLKKDYSDVKTSEDKNSPSLILLADNRIIPPYISHTISASIQMPLEENVNEIEAELYMDYLHGLNN
ncbi:MAG: hypothetical protein IPH52_00030 [Leptospiraceae bacterium]|nr:hypothetical protein [Leptospiraceae bacterium]MBK7053433.1 hypothetical protein [Leptospiraceae bacterium]MBP9888905.1 hypothetical protein [Leptospiraceae bacterium]